MQPVDSVEIHTGATDYVVATSELTNSTLYCITTNRRLFGLC